VSIVDRFLEHARIIYFRHGDDKELFISSADWMPRNLDRRVELLVPIMDPACRRKLFATLETYFEDNQNTWRMSPTGQYKRLSSSKRRRPVRAQRVLYEQACEAMLDIKQNRRATFETHQPRRTNS
jgi:polyphosphate kinase